MKIRGYRINLGEIEATLVQHQDVRQAVVLAREDRLEDKRLIAYIVSELNHKSTSRELRGFLKTKLPDFMIPSYFIFLDALPLTPNGKVDRKALPAPDSISCHPERDFIAPRDNIELQLVQIWEEILNVRPIGVTESFFDIGGHSLLVMRLISQIKSKFGKNFPVATLFKVQPSKILRQDYVNRQFN